MTMMIVAIIVLPRVAESMFREKLFCVSKTLESLRDVQWTLAAYVLGKIDSYSDTGLDRLKLSTVIPHIVLLFCSQETLLLQKPYQMGRDILLNWLIATFTYPKTTFPTKYVFFESRVT